MNTLDTPLALLGLLADGNLYSEQALLKQLNLAPEALQHAICTLQSWGLTVLQSATNAYQLAAPLQRLNQQALRHHSGHNGITLIPVLGSTNQYLLDHRSTLSCGDACVTEYQYAGRGRRGNRWIAPFGTGALFSMYWQLPLPLAVMVNLSLALSIVTAETLHQVGVPEVTVKWPNDLYLNNCKLGGILIETAGTRGEKVPLVIGAGINLSTAPSTALPTTLPPPQQQHIDQPWISLQKGGITVDGNQLIGTILQAWRTALPQFAQQGADPFLARWSSPDSFSGQMVKLSQQAEQKLTGYNRCDRLLIEK